MSQDTEETGIILPESVPEKIRRSDLDNDIIVTRIVLETKLAESGGSLVPERTDLRCGECDIGLLISTSATIIQQSPATARRWNDMLAFLIMKEP